MSKAFKCDKCEQFFTGLPAVWPWSNTKKQGESWQELQDGAGWYIGIGISSSGVEAELCEGCHIAVIKAALKEVYDALS